jgi:TetR/AcrR family transcriptional regulator, repressor for uid operon
MTVHSNNREGFAAVRRVNVQLQSDRRASILAAAESCFTRSGFHQTSMHEICVEAGMSPGNLYRYFPSKEAIIAGICERDRAEAAESFAAVDQAPDFFAGLEALARHHLVERSSEEVGLCAEIMAESRRNPDVARQFQEIEREVKVQLSTMLRRAASRGEIARELDFDGAADVLMALADGLSWRRAVDPAFNAESVMPLILHMIKCLLTQRGTHKQEQDR